MNRTATVLKFVRPPKWTLKPRPPSPLYRMGEVNRCPGCHGIQWHVGRKMAECAQCGTAIDLAEGGR